jgi:ribosomal protein L11 methyltransferase
LIPQGTPNSPEKLYVYEVTKDLSFATPEFLGGWPEGGLFYLFFTRAEDALVSNAAQERGAELLSRRVLPADAWRAPVELPIRVGRFVITGPSTAEQPEPGDIQIRIEPGLVFGGGEHPTTRVCLFALDALLHDTVPQAVLDVGCGTGILAIAAALAGSNRVRGIDINPLAVATAKKNVRLNNVGHRVEVVLGDGLEALDTGDLALMNLGPGLIKKAAGSIRGFRYTIASGFLKGEEANLIEALRKNGLALVARFEEEGWPALLFGRETDV